MLISQHGNHHSKRHASTRDATADTRSSLVSARPRLSWRCKLRASKIWTSEPVAQWGEVGPQRLLFLKS